MSKKVIIVLSILGVLIIGFIITVIVLYRQSSTTVQSVQTNGVQNASIDGGALIGTVIKFL